MSEGVLQQLNMSSVLKVKLNHSFKINTFLPVSFKKANDIVLVIKKIYFWKNVAIENLNTT